MKRPPPDRRFGSLHVDLVGPLPESEGHKYLFTIVDRFSRWPEAIPLVDMSAKTCARAFLRHWVSRYGLPSDVTSDRGRQFTSELWNQLNVMLGIKAQNTTSYHPQSNGLVERLHRQLKGSIMARSSGTDWMDQLPMVMLGIRTACRTELDCSPAELVFGTSLTVPGIMLGDKVEDRQGLPSSEFVTDLFKTMRELSPTEMSHHATAKVQVPSSIETADYVYIRTDAVRPPLVRPYTGPFKVLSKSAKYFTVMKNGSPDTVSIDRLKPAFLLENNITEASKTEKKKVTQPAVFEPKKTERVTKETPEVAVRDYRAALLRDPPDAKSDDARPKRRYVKNASKDVRSDTITTKSGRNSRPPSRF